MSESLNPVTVEVIGSAFSSAVDEMGEALVRASHSTNIKERRDCSTALFDVEGQTLCQAEHIPVHLGSFLDFIPMVLSLDDAEGIRPGDVIVEISQQEVTEPADIEKKVAEAEKAGRKSVLLLLEGQGGLRFVAIRITKG